MSARSVRLRPMRRWRRVQGEGCATEGVAHASKAAARTHEAKRCYGSPVQQVAKLLAQCTDEGEEGDALRARLGRLRDTCERSRQRALAARDFYLRYARTGARLGWAEEVLRDQARAAAAAAATATANSTLPKRPPFRGELRSSAEGTWIYYDPRAGNDAGVVVSLVGEDEHAEAWAAEAGADGPEEVGDEEPWVWGGSERASGDQADGADEQLWQLWEAEEWGHDGACAPAAEVGQASDGSGGEGRGDSGDTHSEESSDSEGESGAEWQSGGDEETALDAARARAEELAERYQEGLWAEEEGAEEDGRKLSAEEGGQVLFADEDWA